MASKRKRTPEDALQLARDILAEHFEPAAIVFADMTTSRRSYVRIVYVCSEGKEAAVDALLERAVDEGESRSDAEASDSAPDGDDDSDMDEA